MSIGGLIAAGFSLAPDLISIGKMDDAARDIEILMSSGLMSGFTAKTAVALIGSQTGSAVKGALDDLWVIGQQIITKNPASAAKVASLLIALGLKES